jgi:hypothetical protein
LEGVGEVEILTGKGVEEIKLNKQSKDTAPLEAILNF